MLKGYTEPRICTEPKRKLTRYTTIGYDIIDFAQDVLQIELVPWQKWLFIHAFELNKDGTFRFRTIIVLIARQNGKSKWAQIVSIFFQFVLRTRLIVGTAQSLDIAEEQWSGAVEMIEGHKSLNEQIDRICRSHGCESMQLVSGERYKVASSNRKGGRGLSSDLVLLDELREHTDWEAWSAITKSTNARPNAMMMCMSNAGDARSIVLRHLRIQAHKDCGDPDGLYKEFADTLEDETEDDDSLGIFEWSAEPECAKTDRNAWCQANPSLGYGFLTERALKSSLKTDPDAEFRTECLCQWIASLIEKPFAEGAWEAGIDDNSKISAKSKLYFGIDMSKDRSRVSVAVCGLRADGNYHIELIDSRHGYVWVEDFLRKLAEKNGTLTIAAQGRGAPIASYVGDLEKLDFLDLTLCEGKDIAGWTGRFYDSVMANIDLSDAVPVMHRKQPMLDDAAQIAQKKSLGDGTMCWDRKNSDKDISSLCACTMAFGLATGGKSENRIYPSAYANDNKKRTLVVV